MRYADREQKVRYSSFNWSRGRAALELQWSGFNADNTSPAALSGLRRRAHVPRVTGGHLGVHHVLAASTMATFMTAARWSI